MLQHFAIQLIQVASIQRIERIPDRFRNIVDHANSIILQAKCRLFRSYNGLIYPAKKQAQERQAGLQMHQSGVHRGPALLSVIAVSMNDLK